MSPDYSDAQRESLDDLGLLCVIAEAQWEYRQPYTLLLLLLDEKLRKKLHSLAQDLIDKFRAQLDRKVSPSQSEQSTIEDLDFKMFREQANSSRLALRSWVACLRSSKVFEEKVLSRMAAPQCCTEEDLIDVAMGLLTTDDDFGSAYAAFIAPATCNIQSQHSEPFVVLDSETLELVNRLVPCWECDSLKLDLMESIMRWSSDGLGFYGRRIHAQLEGAFTPRAFEFVSQTLPPVLRSVLKSLSMAFECYCHESDDADDWDTTLDEELADDADSSQTPTLKPDFVPLSDCLTCYYRVNDSKTLEQRVKNATSLLVEADAQANQVLNLALSCSAIEALVCKKTDGVVDELSRNVATLLQPDAGRRREALKAVKNLYEYRSTFLHGTRLEAPEEACKKARTLAAGCLRAVLEWRRCQLRMEPDSSAIVSVKEDVFFDQLDDATVSGRQMVGVSEKSPSWLPDHVAK